MFNTIILTTIATLSTRYFITYVNENSVAPVMSFGAFDLSKTPFKTGWNFVFYPFYHSGYSMSTLPDNDVAKDLKVKMKVPQNNKDGQENYSGPGVEITMNLQCANKIIPNNATFLAERFSYDKWDDKCIKEVAQAALINAADDFTYNDLTDLGPLNERVTKELFDVSSKIGCHPGEWFELFSCKIISYKLPDALENSLREKTEEHAKWEVESIKLETKKREVERLEFEISKEADRVRLEAKGRADAQEIINFQERNHTEQSYKIEREHQKEMKQDLQSDYAIATYSAALSGSEKMVIGAPGVNLHIDN